MAPRNKNVFDIRQGVAICLATCGGADAGAARAELWGTRESKYSWLAEHMRKGYQLLGVNARLSFLLPRAAKYGLSRGV